MIALLACTKVKPDGAAVDGGRAALGRGIGDVPRERGDGGPEVAFELPEVAPPAPCFPSPPQGAPPTLGDLLDRAAERFDAGDGLGALRCAEEAARLQPSSIEAHHDRAAALLRLGRAEEARTALERALALDPDDTETLAATADVFINRLAPGPDVIETGLELARRGSRLLAHRRRAAQDRVLKVRLALLEAQALNDLGQSREALARAEAALTEGARSAPDAPPAPDWLRLDADYERALALFELCRFEEARRSLEQLVGKKADHAHAHHHLGLILERYGDPRAEHHFGEARKLASDDFRAPLEIAPDEFAAVVEAAVKALPPAMRADLAGVPVEPAELPAEVDLTLEDPPLSPTILGLYRGLPLGHQAAPGTIEEQRSIALYRRNLARIAATRAELEREVKKTLLHEIGHLRGEDDGALRARGLE